MGILYGNKSANGKGQQQGVIEVENHIQNCLVWRSVREQLANGIHDVAVITADSSAYNDCDGIKDWGGNTAIEQDFTKHDAFSNMGLCQQYRCWGKKDSPLLGESSPSRMDGDDLGLLIPRQRQYFMANE